MPKLKHKRAVDLLLDSGAFSAWKKGERVDLRSYIEFVQEHHQLLYSYVNLDVIPGRLGRGATALEVEEAAVESWRNFETMRASGLEPIPVYHLGEREYWLQRILDSGAPWIGLGGSVGKPDVSRHRFFTRCFELIGRSASGPRVHGFGSTSMVHLVRFPWYSVDSTSWVMASAMGAILVPGAAPRGGFDFSRLTSVRVSGLGSQARQASNFGDIYLAHLERFLVSEGTNLTQVRNDQGSRNLVNMSSMARGAQIAGTRLFFSTWMKESDYQASKLTCAGVRDRLLSYWEVRQDEAAFRKYIQYGVIPRRADRGRPGPSGSFRRVTYRGMRSVALASRLQEPE